MKTLKARMSSNIPNVRFGNRRTLPGLIETNLLVDLNESCRGADVELSSEVEGVAVAVLVGDVFGRRASSYFNISMDRHRLHDRSHPW